MIFILFYPLSKCTNTIGVIVLIVLIIIIISTNYNNN